MIPYSHTPESICLAILNSNIIFKRMQKKQINTEQSAKSKYLNRFEPNIVPKQGNPKNFPIVLLNRIRLNSVINRLKIRLSPSSLSLSEMVNSIQYHDSSAPHRSVSYRVVGPSMDGFCRAEPSEN